MNFKCRKLNSAACFPAITVRNSMERPEALDSGTIIITGFDKNIVLNSIEMVIEEFEKGKYLKIPKEYEIDNTSWRVAKLISGMAKLSNKWSGIE
ncbi:MAG: hypothetical protein ABIC04_03510 [Nanoarchaeota archaeon]